MRIQALDLEPERALDGALVRILAVPGSSDQPPPGAVLGMRAPGLTIMRASGRRRVDGPAHSPDDTMTNSMAMTNSTVHDVASVTKVAVTTALTMALVSAGELSLDASMKTYLPSFAGGTRMR